MRRSRTGDGEQKRRRTAAKIEREARHVCSALMSEVQSTRSKPLSGLAAFACFCVARRRGSLLLLRDVGAVAFGVDERVCLGPLLELARTSRPCRSSRRARRGTRRRAALEHLERLGEVVGDFGIVLVVDQPIAGVDVGAADDDDVVGLAAALRRARSRWCSRACGRASGGRPG